MPLAAPVAARTANPAIEHLAVLELDAVMEARHEVDELGFGLVRAYLVHDLESDGRDHAGIVGQRRLGDQYQVLAAAQTGRDFCRRFLAGELAEIFLDVLDFECAGLERVLLDQIFHQCSMPNAQCVRPNRRNSSWAKARS